MLPPGATRGHVDARFPRGLPTLRAAPRPATHGGVTASGGERAAKVGRLAGRLRRPLGRGRMGQGNPSERGVGETGTSRSGRRKGAARAIVSDWPFAPGGLPIAASCKRASVESRAVGVFRVHSACSGKPRRTRKCGAESGTADRTFNGSGWMRSPTATRREVPESQAEGDRRGTSLKSPSVRRLP